MAIDIVKLLKMAIYIVSFRSKKNVFFHSYVNVYQRVAISCAHDRFYTWQKRVTQFPKAQVSEILRMDLAVKTHGTSNCTSLK